MREIKEHDVFHANWKDTTKSNHCFEGLLTVKKELCPAGTGQERLIYVDNFWRSGGNKWWTEKEAEVQLNLRYYCNLSDYDLSLSVKNASLYYDEDDFIFMHDQHACCESCKYFYLKKGATKSRDKILQSLQDKFQECQRKIKSLESSMDWVNKDIEKALIGDLDSIWI